MKGRQLNSAKSKVRISAPALKATHHETKLHNLSHLTGREGGPPLESECQPPFKELLSFSHLSGK